MSHTLSSIKSSIWITLMHIRSAKAIQSICSISILDLRISELDCYSQVMDVVKETYLCCSLTSTILCMEKQHHERLFDVLVV